MRLVIDTNVFVSAALKESSWPAHAVRWAERHGGLLKSVMTEREVLAVLQRPKIACKLPETFFQNVCRMMDSAELVSIDEPVMECRDPDDDKFLELAVNGRADVIVSGDSDLLVLVAFRGIPIVTAAEFGRALLV